MFSGRSIRIIECHAEGEVGDVIVDGVDPPPGDTVWEQSRWIANDDRLRRFVLNEPRGGVYRHCNLLVPPKHPDADAAFIIMEPCDTPPMSGSNSMCVATVVLETGIVEIVEPETRLILEAPGGLVSVLARCREGKVESVTVQNVASFAQALGEKLDVPGLGNIDVDTAYGGDSFVVVSAEALGLEIAPRAGRHLAELGVRISDAATNSIGFRHPLNPDWRHISFCLFGTAPEWRGAEAHTRHAVAIRPGKIDRSPTGTGVCARLALMHARGEAPPGTRLVAESIIGSRFVGRIADSSQVGDLAAVIPTIEGRARIFGERRLLLDPDDPWPLGYRVSDTWPG